MNQVNLTVLVRYHQPEVAEFELLQIPWPISRLGIGSNVKSDKTDDFFDLLTSLLTSSSSWLVHLASEWATESVSVVSSDEGGTNAAVLPQGHHSSFSDTELWLVDSELSWPAVKFQPLKDFRACFGEARPDSDDWSETSTEIPSELRTLLKP